MNDRIREAFDRVVAEMNALDQEQLKAKLEQHKDGDLARPFIEQTPDD